VHATRPAVASIGAIAILFLAACQPAQQQEQPSFPPPPPPIGAKVDPARIIEVGRTLTYDENPGASDESILEDGVRAIIEPQVGVWQLDSATLDQGIVVGRFRNRTDKPLRRLGLLPGGVTYWFIYRQEGKLLSAYVPDTTARDFDVTEVETMYHHATRPWRQSVAQFQLPDVLRHEKALRALGVDTNGQPWISCTGEGCCKGQ